MQNRRDTLKMLGLGAMVVALPFKAQANEKKNPKYEIQYFANGDISAVAGDSICIEHEDLSTTFTVLKVDAIVVGYVNVDGRVILIKREQGQLVSMKDDEAI